jgi:hypothetical protein
MEPRSGGESLCGTIVADGVADPGLTVPRKANWIE